MEEYKFYFKWPKWLLIFVIAGYSLMAVGLIWYTVFIIKNISDIKDLFFSEIITLILSYFGLLLLVIFGWYVIVESVFRKNYYYVINSDGIYNNQTNLIKKFISWEDELYYCVTDSYMGLYKSKMLPLEKEILNEKNITDGYISIKTKKALKKFYDNKGWIAIWTCFLKDDVKITDIISMINKSRENKYF